MELTRRDAVAALAAVGIGGSGLYYWRETGAERSTDFVETIGSLAEVVYPSSVTGGPEFARTYATGRIDADASYEEVMTDAARALDSHALERRDAVFRDLDTEEGDDLLREIGMDRVHPDPEGSELARIKYYLVNELLYALLASPKGGELAGIGNPPGHPGGLESYRKGPQR